MNRNPQVKELKKILDALSRAEKLDNDSAESLHDAQIAKLKALPKENILAAVEEAVGNNAKRKSAAVHVFSELYDVEGIEEIFIGLLNSADEADRVIIIQTIGLRKLKVFVPVLNEYFHHESDPGCKSQILHALATIADESSFPLFLELAYGSDRTFDWRLLVGFAHFGRPEAQPFLEKKFNSRQSNLHEKTLAAWGLAKIGVKAYYEYLAKLLDDRDYSTATSYSPGQSLRAAQAICDINNWDFQWNADFVEIVKARVKKNSL